MARLLVVLFALLVLGVGLGLAALLLGGGAPALAPALTRLADATPVDPSDTTPELFAVPRGASAAQIGDDLQRRGLIRSALAFRFVVEQEGVGASLAAGDYELSRSMSTREIAQVLARGQVKRGLVVTIPEGWRAEQIADKLEATGFSSRDEFLRAVADPASVPGSELLPGAPATLEGYLFPETYEVKERVPGTQAAELMVRTFLRRVDQPLRLGGVDAQLGPRELLIVASIVEREAQLPSERSTIAGVYLNRLARGMPLQADPTVQYAVASRDGRAAAAYGYWKRDLTAPDLQVDSPFNTYLRSGLPPGPISNPGEESIRATLQPAKTDYLYFVANGDGSHLFARTLDEHNANVARVGR